MKAVFVNFSNHKLENWKQNQIDAAHQLGKTIIDVPFPNVSPLAGKEEIVELAEISRQQIIAAGGFGDFVVMVQGEPSLCFHLIAMLIADGTPVVVSTTARIVRENPDGTKTSDFQFARFREI